MLHLLRFGETNGERVLLKMQRNRFSGQRLHKHIGNVCNRLAPDGCRVVASAGLGGVAWRGRCLLRLGFVLWRGLCRLDCRRGRVVLRRPLFRRRGKIDPGSIVFILLLLCWFRLWFFFGVRRRRIGFALFHGFRRGLLPCGTLRGNAFFDLGFEAIQPRFDICQRNRILRAADVHQRAFEQGARRGQIAHVVLRGDQAIQREHQPCFRCALCLLKIARHRVLCAVQQILAPSAGLGQQQRAKMRRKIGGKDGKIAPGLHDGVQLPQRVRRVGGKQRLGHIEQKRVLHAAQHVVNVLRGHVVPAEREALIGKRKRVAHAALRRAGNQGQAAVFNGSAGAGKHAGKRALDVRNRNSVKIKPLTAGDDRCGKLLRLGGREDEENVFRRLLQRFEQRVERRAGEHMNLVDDKHASAELERRVLRVFDQIAHVVDAVVARGVDLRDVGCAFGGGD